MQYETKRQWVQAVKANVAITMSPGDWLVSDSLGNCSVMGNAEFTAHFEEVKTPPTTGRINTAQRIAKTRETLTVPKAHPPLNPKAGSVNDTILGMVGTKPVAAKDIIAAVGGKPAKARGAIARLTKKGALKSEERGFYVLGRR